MLTQAAEIADRLQAQGMLEPRDSSLPHELARRIAALTQPASAPAASGQVAPFEPEPSAWPELASTVPQTVQQMYDVLVGRDLLFSRAELLRSLERQGVLVLDTIPERLTVDAVNRYLSLKTGVRM